MTKNAMETGRSMVEILGVLAIMGLLSVCGVWGYSHFMVQREVDTILDTLQQKTIEIDSAQEIHPITDPVEFDTFLKGFETTVGAYKLSFHSTSDASGSFTSEVTNKDGSKIKGAFCRKLITKMVEQKFVSNVGFSLKNEPQEDGSNKDVNLLLHGLTVDYKDICGG